MIGTAEGHVQGVLTDRLRNGAGFQGDGNGSARPRTRDHYRSQLWHRQGGRTAARTTTGNGGFISAAATLAGPRRLSGNWKERPAHIFEIVLMDVGRLASVRAAIETIKLPIDAVVMNAGGAGGKEPSAITEDGVTSLFGGNVLGHVALLEELISSGRLTEGAVYVGSGRTRRPKMGMKRPALPDSSVQNFVDVCIGKVLQEKV